MHRNIRYGAAFILFFSILFLAHTQLGQADAPAEPSLSASEDPKFSALPAKPDDCKKERKGKECKGTVKGPPIDIIIPVTGQYSVAGLCTLINEFTDPEILLNATLMDPLPGDLPAKVQKVRQGCLLTYYQSNQLINELVPASGSTTICFAGNPAKPTTVYFYDLYGPAPAWVPLETTLQDGLACAPANTSGVYVATFTP